MVHVYGEPTRDELRRRVKRAALRDLPPYNPSHRLTEDEQRWWKRVTDLVIGIITAWRRKEKPQ